MHRHSTMDSYYSLYLTLEMAYQMWRKNHNYTFRNFDEIKNQPKRPLLRIYLLLVFHLIKPYQVL